MTSQKSNNYTIHRTGSRDLQHIPNNDDENIHKNIMIHNTNYGHNNDVNDDEKMIKLFNDATQELIDKMDEAFLQFNGDDDVGVTSNHSIDGEEEENDELEDNIIEINALHAHNGNAKHSSKHNDIKNSDDDQVNEKLNDNRILDSDSIGLLVQQNQHPKQEQGNLLFNTNDENNQGMNIDIQQNLLEIRQQQQEEELEQKNTDWDDDDNSFFALTDHEEGKEEESDHNYDDSNTMMTTQNNDVTEVAINNMNDNGNENDHNTENGRPRPQDQPEQCMKHDTNVIDDQKERVVIEELDLVEEKKQEEIEVDSLQHHQHQDEEDDEVQNQEVKMETKQPLDAKELQTQNNNDQDNMVPSSSSSSSSSTIPIVSSSPLLTSPNRNHYTSSSHGKINHSSPSSQNSSDEILHHMYLNQSKTEELVESHAEDILSLTLEIQTLREQLKNERNEHEKTKHYLSVQEEKSVQLEKNIQTLQSEVQNIKDNHEREMERILKDNEGMKLTVMEAEEDARKAFDLAKESDLKMSEMEVFLSQALDEVEQLRSNDVVSGNQLPMISEQFSNERSDGYDSLELSSDIDTPRKIGGRSPILSATSPFNRERVGIAMGRNIMRQITESDDNLSTASASTFGSTTSNTSSYLANLTRRSAEKRQKLRESMKRSIDVGPTGKEVLFYSSSQSVQNNLDLKSENETFLTTLKKVDDTMKQSGKKLNLGGRWFNGPSSMSLKSKRPGQLDNDALDTELLARYYCRSVEALVSKQREDVKELKNFCGYLEQRLQVQQD
jgi:hypothetical protein